MGDIVDNAKDHFEKLIREQLERVEQMKQAEDWRDFSSIKPIIIGVAGGFCFKGRN
jgi:isocitrate dehydrogenase (NAD+)